MIWINSYVSNSQRMLIWKINKLISSGGIHGWRVGAVVNRQGLCCTFGWTRKSPRQHTGKGHDRADGYPLTLFTRACQTNDATGVTRWSSWIEAKSQVCPPPHLLLNFSLQLSPNSSSSFILPYYAFTSFLSIPSFLAYLKPKISWLHSQARWREVNCSQGETWHIC